MQSSLFRKMNGHGSIRGPTGVCVESGHGSIRGSTGTEGGLQDGGAEWQN